MSPRRSWFTKLEPLAIPIRIANDHVVYSEGVGSVVLEPADKSLHPVLLSRVLYVPALQNNLLAVLHLVANHRFRIEIEGKEMVFLQNGEHRFTAAIRDNTAWLNASTPPFDKLILCLHDDKGSEFIGIKWDAFFAQHGIHREHTVKVLPQQNGVAEHLNRTLEELLVAMLNSARLPVRFWGEGLNYLRHVIVCSPSSLIPAGTTPYKMVHKCKPDYSPLHVFGCCAWAHIQRKERKSL
jgi:transposase InsO family protein